MPNTYDLEGYYCLIIAILMGVNAKEARILYEYGLNTPVSRKILKMKRLKKVRVSTRKERSEEIRRMTKEGYTTAVIADALNCDDSTVRRNIKKQEDKNDDEYGSVC